MTEAAFWGKLEALVATNDVIIDRPAGTGHPSYPGMLYPVDYGYLDGTAAVDGAGVDIFVGTTGLARVDGALLTVDLAKSDAEVKILYSCTLEEMQTIQAFVESELTSGLLVVRG